eukprot:s637_g15.t1
MSCSSCRDRFELPIGSSGTCAVCHTLQRLNRVILTRHPAAESSTLLRLLTRTLDKVEGFVEEFEENLALGASLSEGLPLARTGGRAPDPVEVKAPGLTPVSKRSSAPKKSEAGEAPAVKTEEGEEQPEASGARPARSKSEQKKKDKKKKRREKEGETHRSRERKKKREESRVKEPLEEERPEETEPENRRERERDEESEESPTREDRRSPSRRRDVSHHSPAREDERVPRSPSRSPPGFARERETEWRDRTPIKRDKPKKDKGYNHYLRGRDFRERYGFDRGRGRGAGRW